LISFSGDNEIKLIYLKSSAYGFLKTKSREKWNWACDALPTAADGSCCRKHI